MNDKRGNELRVGDKVSAGHYGGRRLYVVAIHDRDLVIGDGKGNTWAVGPEEVRVVQADKGAGTN